MKVRLLTDRAGATFEQHEGDVIDVPDAEGRALLKSGSAEPVAPANRREAAVTAPARNAALPDPQPRKGN